MATRRTRRKKSRNRRRRALQEFTDQGADMGQLCMCGCARWIHQGRYGQGPCATPGHDCAKFKINKNHKPKEHFKPR